MSDKDPKDKRNTEPLPEIDESQIKRKDDTDDDDDLKKDADETLSLKDVARSRRRKDKNDDSDFVQKTTVISRDNPILRRALSHQAGQDATDEEADEIPMSEEIEIVLVIRGMVERIPMREGIIYKVGRYELGMKNDDEIDLTPYGATDRGVSRLHAQMFIEDGVLHVEDLGSTNGTYLGGKRLEPNTPTPLKKGDEVLFGRLAVQVMFR